MIGLVLRLILIVSALLCILTVFQTMYTDSLRLRGPALPALDFFKETLEDRIGLETRHGVLVISLIKHTLLLMLGILCVATALGTTLGWETLAEAALLAGSPCCFPPMFSRRCCIARPAATGCCRWPRCCDCRPLVRPLTAVLGFFQSLVELAEAEKVQVEAPGPANDIEALIMPARKKESSRSRTAG